MTTQANTRSAMLERIREAVASDAAEIPRTYAALAREYDRQGRMSAEDRLALMIERLREYEAEVTECTTGDIPQAIARVVEASGRRVLVAGPELPAEWRVSGCEWHIDHGLAQGEIERMDGVVTAATCAIAESGTVVLHHTRSEGRRLLSLLPDWHLCVLHASQVVETLPEYSARCPRPPALATFISGPSATADIEMTRIKGVHGPRFLNVLIVHDMGNTEPGAAPGAKGAQ